MLEGLVTIAFSVVALYIIPNFPEDAKFLTEEEHVSLVSRLEDEGLTEVSDTSTHLWKNLTNWKIWLA